MEIKTDNSLRQRLGRLLGFHPSNLSLKESEIIEAAIRCMSKTSPDTLSLERIAQNAGVSRSLMNYYFKSREDLISKCLLHIRSQYQVHVIDAIKRPLPSATSKIKRYLSAVFSWPREKPLHARMWLYHYNKTAIESDWKQKNTEWVQLGTDRLSALIEEGHSLGEWSAEDSMKIARQLQAYMTGSLISALTENNSQSLAELAEESFFVFQKLASKS
jgi:AcrR family transcriptional regulator